MNRYLVFLIFLILSCKSAKEAFKDGDYEKSYKKALNDIKDKKDVRANKSILNKSLVKLTDEMAFIKLRTLKDKEKLYDRYIKVNNYFTEAKSYLDSSAIKSNVTMISNRKMLNDDIVAELFQGAKENLDIAKRSNNKGNARECHQALTRIKFKYDHNIADIDQRIEEAYKHALMVYVFYVDMPFNYNEEYEVNQQFRNLSSQGNSNYDKVYYGDQYKNLDADCKIRLSFDDLDDQVNNSQYERNFSEQIEDGYTQEKDTSGVVINKPKYQTVYATVQITQKKYQFSWQVSGSNIGNTSSCNFENRKRFYAQITKDLETYQISGDRRAVPREYLNGNNGRLDKDEIMDDLIEDLYNQIRSYYF